MALTVYEQIIEYLQNSKRIVVALESKLSADAIGAAIGVRRILEKYEKPFQITVEQTKDEYSFLTKNISITSGLNQARRLVVSLDIADQGLEKFYYNLAEDKKKLEIFIVPKDGFFNPDDVRVGQGGFEYDLIITIGAADFGALGTVYQRNASFFHETPIINIDYKAANEKFGEINLVEPTKSSCAEIVFDFLEQRFPDALDKSVSTALLAGILEKTESFRVPTLAPQTLEKASRLMALKADRELAVRELFYNKPLSLVKLWGRALARLKEDASRSLYWSLINSEDYERSGATSKLIDQVFEEIFRYLPRDSTVVLFSEFNGAVMALAHSGKPAARLEEIFGNYKLQTFENGVRFTVWDKSLLELENEVIAAIKP